MRSALFCFPTRGVKLVMSGDNSDQMQTTVNLNSIPKTLLPLNGYNLMAASKDQNNAGEQSQR